MKNLFKGIFVGIASLAMVACSSTPTQAISYEKVGRVERVVLMSVEAKPSFVEVFAGATVGGLLGNQFGGGSAKYWTTAIGALGGAKVVDEALSKKYKEIHFYIRYSDGTREKMVSTDLAPTVFKNDLVIVKRYNEDFDIRAFGKYTKQRMKLLEEKFRNGEI